MTYLYVVAGRMSDPELFAEAGKTWAGERFLEMGALSATANQVIMGGEMAGTVLVAFETETADGAMNLNAAIYGDNEMVKLITDAGVQVGRRSLMRTQAEFGTRTGPYSTNLYMAGPPIADDAAQANFAHAWTNIEPGANGMAALQLVAGGASPFSAVAVTWADSIDDLLAASAKNFADPATQEMMASAGSTVLGRVISRRLF